LDRIVRQSVGGREIGEGAVAITREAAAAGADPQVAGAVLEQAPDVVVMDLRRVARAEYAEAHAVEAHHAGLRREPEIAVARLHDREDGVLRQAAIRVVGAPDPVAVLRQRE